MAANQENQQGNDLSPAAGARSLWARPAGYRDVLRIAVPLALSTGSWSIQHFVDRMFLSWYSTAALAASPPAGMFAFTVMSFFVGTASYTNAFVAQYHGAGRSRRVGPAIWQAIYFTLAAGLFLMLFGRLGDGIFRLVGHEAQIRDLESRYFRIIMLAAVFPVYNNALSAYFTGLGRTWPVMWVNATITGVNLTLDYALIFGNWGFPELGIEGAAWATNIANGCGAVVYSTLVFSKRANREHATRSGWRFDRDLFRRLMRFGAPSGLHLMLEIMAFSFFYFIMGRIGTKELAATVLAFQINTLAFLPMLGFGFATTAMVGQWLGRNKPDLAARATWSSFHLTFAYMATIASLYVVAPSLFIYPFASKADPAQFAEVARLARLILFFVAAYLVFDTMNVIFAAALKGAGDTRFVMSTSVALAWSVMVLPAWLLAERAGGGVFIAWTFCAAYICILGLVFLARFLRGKWRTMRVIERPTPGPIASPLPETPMSEVEM